ncbi:MAG: ATP-binding protein [Gordonibacter pamelaeae]
MRLEASEKPSADSIVAYRCVTFVVADDGIGMTEEFHRAPVRAVRHGGPRERAGYGLGMPIVKNIVTMMGGDIHVRTAVDQGTTFTITVNLRLAFEPERRALAAAERAGDAWEGSLDVSGRPQKQPQSHYRGGFRRPVRNGVACARAVLVVASIGHEVAPAAARRPRDGSTAHGGEPRGHARAAGRGQRLERRDSLRASGRVRPGG